MGGSCARGAFETHFHETNSSSVNRLSTRKFEYHNVDAIYLSCVVRRCIQEPCGVCAERRLGEGGADVEDEVVTVVKQVRLQNFQMPKVTGALISTAQVRQAAAATFL